METEKLVSGLRGWLVLVVALGGCASGATRETGQHGRSTGSSTAGAETDTRANGAARCDAFKEEAAAVLQVALNRNVPASDHLEVAPEDLEAHPFPPEDFYEGDYVPDLDDDGVPDCVVVHPSSGTSSLAWVIFLSNHGQPRQGGALVWSRIEVLPTTHEGVTDLQLFTSSGCAGLAGTVALVRWTGDGWQFAGEPLECSCPDDPDPDGPQGRRPALCPPVDGDPGDRAAQSAQGPAQDDPGQGATTQEVEAWFREQMSQCNTYRRGLGEDRIFFGGDGPVRVRPAAQPGRYVVTVRVLGGEHDVLVDFERRVILPMEGRNGALPGGMSFCPPGVWGGGSDD